MVALPAAAADAVLGVAPRLTVEPASVDEAAEVMRACAGDGLALLFGGGGTDLELGAPPRELDVLLRTRRLARVVEHAPADQIATVEAGMPLAAFQEHLAAHGQRLALDPPRPRRATVGGVVAANAFGPRRLRYGSARDLVVGMSFVRADGTAARGGGKVVKNVAGFDVPRLLVGSLGTLALVTTVTVRLHPLPETETTVLLPGLSAASLRPLVKALAEAQLEPTSAAAIAEGAQLRLGVRFEGFAPGVAEGRDRLLALAARVGAAAEPLADGAARAFWERHDDIRSEGSLRARISAPAASVALVQERVLAPLAAALRPAAAVLYPTLGFAFVSGEPAEVGAVVRAVEDGRAALAPLGGSLVLTAAPDAVRARADVWGPPPPSLAVMRRVKEALDPKGRLAPGRFVGGI
jgi:glycolate dehydrogenase FAD-binding subunit